MFNSPIEMLLSTMVVGHKTKGDESSHVISWNGLVGLHLHLSFLPITSTPKVMHMLSNIRNMITQQGIEFNTHFLLPSMFIKNNLLPKI
jgi:hypothetical protein